MKRVRAANRPKAFRENSKVGTERNCGAPFTWSLSSKGFCRRLTVLVDVGTFLAQGNIQTSTFDVGGHKWCFELLQMQGQIGAYLHSRNKTDVAVHYSVAVVNQTNHDESIVKGSTRQFAPLDAWGFKLMSVSQLMNPKSNFLSDDGILELRLDVRLRHKDHERQFSHSSHKSAICVWKLRGLDKQNPWMMKSKEFTIGNTTWALHLYPTGNDLVGKYMAVGMQCLSHKSVRAKVAILPTSSLEVQRITEASLEKRRLSTINSIPGHPEFLHRDKLLDSRKGYIDEEGFFGLVSYISIEDAENESSNQQATNSTQVTAGCCIDHDCQICYDKPKTAGIVHGEWIHRELCSSCTKILYDRRHFDCPFCRIPIDCFIELTVE